MNEPLFVLIGRTVVLMRARAGLYALAVAVSLALETAILAFFPGDRGTMIASGIVIAALQAVVYARVVVDDAVRDGRPAPFSVSARVLERLWAVIVIDFGADLINLGLGRAIPPGDEFSAELVQIAALLVSALLLVSDVSATLDERTAAPLLVPRSVERSVRFFFSIHALRVMVLVALQYVVTYATIALGLLFFGDSLPPYWFWMQVAVGTIVTPPLAALTALVYRDAQRAHE